MGPFAFPGWLTMVISVKSNQRTQFIDITRQIQQAVSDTPDFQEGWCLVYVPHTTAAVTINESADPSVCADIIARLDALVPWQAGYRHLEGNSAAHIKSSLMGASQFVAVETGRLVLGTWQGIFFCEFDGPRTRKVHIQLYHAGQQARHG